MNNFSLIYEIMWPLTRPAIRIFYKRIQFKNLSNLPPEGAVLLCGNHVNAFMDPVSVQLHTSRQVFSLARGDAFKKPLMHWVLTQLKIMPIYRISEGVENLHKNEDSFLASSKVLINGNPLIIYPEAICVQERRIRKLKKGAARIAFGVEEQSDFEAGLVILPLGVNYSDPKKFRSNLFINFGEPIKATKYADLYKSDKAKAINELTADIEKAMKKLVVNIHHKENDQFVEELYLVYKEQLRHDMGLDPHSLEDDFKVSRDIAEAVNYFQINEPQLVETAKEKMSTYLKMLNEFGLTDHLFTPGGLQSISGARLAADIVLSVIGMPVFVAGLIMNYLPYKLGHTMANKLAKEVEFHASINMTISWFSWIAYYLLQLLAVALLFRNWTYVGAYALLAPLTGMYVLRFYPVLQMAAARRKIFSLKKNNKTQFEKLIGMRKELIEFLDNAKRRYCGTLEKGI